jgi:hypothetical protein
MQVKVATRAREAQQTVLRLTKTIVEKLNTESASINASRTKPKPMLTELDGLKMNDGLRY